MNDEQMMLALGNRIREWAALEAKLVLTAYDPAVEHAKGAACVGAAEALKSCRASLVDLVMELNTDGD